ncbi:MAG TPA: hypothetical protein VIK63_00415 [Haloplasmataceae bacterium]
MSLKSIFLKDVETRDHHPQPAFRTRYYKNEYSQVKDMILRYLNENKLRIINVEDNYGEILADGGNYDLIISIKRVTVVEHAVDFKVTMRTLLGLNRPAKIVTSLYNYLDRHLNAQGIGPRGF